MKFIPTAADGGMWLPAFWTPGGPNNPLLTDLANELLPGVIVVQRDPTARGPSTCNRQAGPAPTYLPCGVPAWLAGTGAPFFQIDAAGPSSDQQLPIAPTLDNFTVEVSTNVLGANADTGLDVYWADATADYGFEFEQFTPPTTGGFLSLTAGPLEDYLNVDGPGLAGTHRWCFQRSATATTLFCDGAVVGQVARTTPPITLTQGGFGDLFFLLFGDDPQTLMFSRIMVSTVARHPDSGYDATQPLTVDGNTLLLWRLTEQSGDTTWDQVVSAALYNDNPPAISPWPVTPPPGL